MSEIKLTVLFEDPFYVGVFERYENKKIFITRVVFGVEPTPPQIYEFILSKFGRLQFVLVTSFTKKIIDLSKINPKRRQRKASKDLKDSRSVRKAQNALKESYKNRLKPNKINN